MYLHPLYQIPSLIKSRPTRLIPRTLILSSLQRLPKTHTLRVLCCLKLCNNSSRDGLTTDRLQDWEMLVVVSKTLHLLAVSRSGKLPIMDLMTYEKLPSNVVSST